MLTKRFFTKLSTRSVLGGRTAQAMRPQHVRHMAFLSVLSARQVWKCLLVILPESQQKPTLRESLALSTFPLPLIWSELCMPRLAWPRWSHSLTPEVPHPRRWLWYSQYAIWHHRLTEQILPSWRFLKNWAHSTPGSGSRTVRVMLAHWRNDPRSVYLRPPASRERHVPSSVLGKATSNFLPNIPINLKDSSGAKSNWASFFQFLSGRSRNTHRTSIHFSFGAVSHSKNHHRHICRTTSETSWQVFKPRLLTAFVMKGRSWRAASLDILDHRVCFQCAFWTSASRDNTPELSNEHARGGPSIKATPDRACMLWAGGLQRLEVNRCTICSGG